MTHKAAPLVSIIGPEGSGKTTLCNLLAQRLGGIALQIPEWPSLASFLRNPAAHAYENQVEAMDHMLASCLAAIATGRTVLADSCPTRVHQVHSHRLREEGLLSENQWRQLAQQYEDTERAWGSRYIYLRATEAVLDARLRARGREEDLAHNLSKLGSNMRRWQDVVDDPNWRQDKQLLELDGAAPLEDNLKVAIAWVDSEGHYAQ